MTVPMDKNVAYVKFVSDDDNPWAGLRGFGAVFHAQGEQL